MFALISSSFVFHANMMRHFSCCLKPLEVKKKKFRLQAARQLCFVVRLQLWTNKKKKRYYSMDFCLSGTGQLTIFSYSRTSSSADASDRPCRAVAILLQFNSPFFFFEIFTLPHMAPPIWQGRVQEVNTARILGSSSYINFSSLPSFLSLSFMLFARRQRQ